MIKTGITLFSPLGTLLKEYLSKKQIAEVEQAFQLADRAHAPQKRESGEAYITHPIAVAKILAAMHMDANTIIAAILHDVIEDTGVKKKEIADQFGTQVADLVDGVSKLARFDFKTKAEAQAANFRKMMMAMARDIRVIIIKLADRLHNMRTLGHVPPDKRRRIAKETLEIYAPIANRLGMRSFRDEFQKLGFQSYHPMRYQVLEQSVKKARGNRKEVIHSIEESLNKSLKSAGIKVFDLWGREKSLYSVYRKMLDKRLHFNEVMDVYAFRIIVDSSDLCYRALGAVHSLYKPVPERFKDYIAIPKSNGYQSLHTTLFGPYGLPIEIQIRTKQMNYLAENGIAAHWLYKIEDYATSSAQLRAREWIKGVLEIQQSTGDLLEFIEDVKVDLFPDEVYVFTPSGEILELPNGATAVDFAYAVHSDIGNACIAVKLDKRLSPLSAPLKSGQRVEVITAPGARPNPVWLNFVVTGKARSNIRFFLKQQQRSESVELGKRMLDQALLQFSLTIDQIAVAERQQLIKETEYQTLDDLYEAIGLGNQMAPIIAQRMAGVEGDGLQAVTAEVDVPLSIKGTEGMAVHFARCCYPIPGDSIVGVLTSGRGIVVHSETCTTLHSFMHKHADKCMPLRWEQQMQEQFGVPIIVEMYNRRGSLAALALAIADADSNINDVHVLERDNRYVKVSLMVTVYDRDHLARLIKRVRQGKGVMRIYRRRELE
jgi:GTP diphosphokinase / guanosine-3',5'-bis(diphosphate) 3'-diphosphatase